MIKDDIIDELIPSENFGDFTYPSFTDFDTLNKKFIGLANTNYQTDITGKPRVGFETLILI